MTRTAFGRMVRRIGLILMLVAGLPSAALAQPQQNQPPTHDQVIPYIFVVFCVLLGIILVCRSAGRSKDVKIDRND